MARNNLNYLDYFALHQKMYSRMSSADFRRSVMAKARSPEYPAIGLREAIERVKMVYQKDYQNRLPKRMIAEHLGYKGLSGASLPILSALAKYGLLEGRGDETRVSDLAVALIAHAPGTPERCEALKQASTLPELFEELDHRFPDGRASDQAIRSYLLTRKFIPGAADAAIRAYRDTKQLVEEETGGFTPGAQHPVETAAINSGSSPTKPPTIPRPPEGMLQEVFVLDEGNVTLTFPAQLSLESYQDLADHLEIFLRKAKRRADAMRAHRDIAGEEADG
jgi:hypothetical protein